ncbi:MAG: NAD(P)/FAD-dependent oxidoreductase [Nocardioidaceae bacterium]
MTRIVVVGASVAGLRATQALRAAGYDGELVVVGDEPHPPYDRPPLSKAFLLGKIDAPDLALAGRDTMDSLGARWLLGGWVTGLDVHRRRAMLDDGDDLEWDGVVIATGARARRLPFGHELEGVHQLRTIEDAAALRCQLKSGARVVMIGAGFIGAEVAATASTLGAEVTIVDVAAEPFAQQLGALSARLLRAVHGEHGVRLVTGRPARYVAPNATVVAVEMDDGSVLPADVVVVGVGATPNVEWLDGSPVSCDDGVLTDERGRTNVPAVVAAGDVARYRSLLHRGSVRVEHWTNARDMPVTAALALLAHVHEVDPADVPAYDPVPYVWSDQYDHHIQIAGRADAGAEFVVVDGDLESRRFVAVQRRGGETAAIVSWDTPKLFRTLRRELETRTRGLRERP